MSTSSARKATYVPSDINRIATVLASSTASPARSRGRPRGVALAELMTRADFSTELAKIRADSGEYLKSNLQEMKAKLKPNYLDPAMLHSYVRTQETAAASARHLEFLLPTGFVLRTRTEPLSTLGEPVGEAIFVDPPGGNFGIRHGFAHVDGEGDGLTGFDIADYILAPFAPHEAGGGDQELTQADWAFEFTAPEDGEYLFDTRAIAWGQYMLAADDGWPDSKKAACTIVANAKFPQLEGISSGDNRYSVMLDIGDDNILETDNFVLVQELSSWGRCTGGESLPLHVAMYASVFARGEDSVAEVNMLEGIGGFACLGVRITRLGQ